MAMSGAQFSQQYGPTGVQQMGSAVNPQLQSKAAISNNLPQFPAADLKGVGNVPNMVSLCPPELVFLCVFSPLLSFYLSLGQKYLERMFLHLPVHSLG